MSRGGQAWATAGGAFGGLIVGLVGGRVATMSMKDQKMRSNVVLGTSLAGAAGGAAIVSYTTSKHLQLSA